MPITAFDVAIGDQTTWHPVEVVPVDTSRKINDPMPVNGVEYRYWRMKVIENGVTEEVDGRLLIAGPTAIGAAPTSIVVPKGVHPTWGRLRVGDEVVIDKAQGLVIE